MTTTFDDIGVQPAILQAVAELGFTTPTPIQVEAIPLILQKKCDLISLAQTGTGKTAAFGIPLLQQTDTAQRRTQTLVLCPTRELCIQVSRDLGGLAKYMNNMKILAVYGGARIDLQISALKQGVHVIVATPGRLLDLIRRHSVDISAISTVVLDEADEMLNMGFQEELNAILAETPQTKQTLLFSATMPGGIATIAGKYMRNPVKCTIGTANAGAENVEHVYYMVHAKNRYLALKRIVDHNPGIYAIIFCRTRQETQEVADKLARDGYQAEPLHGDLSQLQRDRIMDRFRRREIQLLVATDVAARGLDIQDLTHVINFNLPDDLAAYTHRSGRTGRAGKKGQSLSIIHMREKYRIKEIEKRLKKRFQHQPVPTGLQVCERQLQKFLDTVLDVTIHHEHLDPLLPAIEAKLAGLDRREVIERMVSLTFNRFLTYYENAPDLNQQEQKTSPSRREGYGPPQRSQSDEERFTRFQLNVGKQDGVLPARLIATLNQADRSRKIAVGKISISEHATFIDADNRHKDAVLKAFKGIMINGRPVRIEEVAGRQKSSGDKMPRQARFQSFKKKRSTAGKKRKI